MNIKITQAHIVQRRQNYGEKTVNDDKKKIVVFARCKLLVAIVVRVVVVVVPDARRTNSVKYVHTTSNRNNNIQLEGVTDTIHLLKLELEVSHLKEKMTTTTTTSKKRLNMQSDSILYCTRIYLHAFHGNLSISVYIGNFNVCGVFSSNFSYYLFIIYDSVDQSKTKFSYCLVESRTLLLSMLVFSGTQLIE